MRSVSLSIVLIVVASAFVPATSAAHAQSWQPPAEGERCPSKWGAGDQRGSGNQMYNCFKLDEVATRNGFEKLGIENVGTLITRGIMIDVAGLKGVEWSCGKQK